MNRKLFSSIIQRSLQQSIQDDLFLVKNIWYLSANKIRIITSSITELNANANANAVQKELQW